MGKLHFEDVSEAQPPAGFKRMEIVEARCDACPGMYSNFSNRNTLLRRDFSLKFFVTLFCRIQSRVSWSVSAASACPLLTRLAHDSCLQASDSEEEEEETKAATKVEAPKASEKA